MERSSGHVVVCGNNRLSRRTTEWLERLGCDVFRFDHPTSPTAEDLAGLRLESACALVLCSDADVDNLRTALAATELNPDLRVVMRMFNTALAEGLSPLLDSDVEMLSLDALAAPTFSTLATGGELWQRLDIDGFEFGVRSARASGDGDLPLERGATLLPAGDIEAGDLVLQTCGRSRRSGYRPGRLTRLAFHDVANVAWQLIADRRIRVLLAVGVCVLCAWSALIASATDRGPVDAFFFAATVVTTVAFDAVDLRSEPALVQILAVGLALADLLVVTLLFAIVTDVVLSVRITRALGGPALRARDHFVVCGLGTVGFRIATDLLSRGYRVVAAEVDPDNRFLGPARRLGIPVVVGGASELETLSSLGIDRARAVLAITNDDACNLETAVSARTLNPRARIVVRLYDEELARRAESLHAVDASRSVSAIAAPLFAASALRHDIDGAVATSNGLITLQVTSSSDATSATSAGDTSTLVLQHDGSASPAVPGAPVVPGTHLLVAQSVLGLTSSTAAVEDALVPSA